MSEARRKLVSSRPRLGPCVLARGWRAVRCTSPPLVRAGAGSSLAVNLTVTAPLCRGGGGQGHGGALLPLVVILLSGACHDPAFLNATRDCDP